MRLHLAHLGNVTKLARRRRGRCAATRLHLFRVTLASHSQVDTEAGSRPLRPRRWESFHGRRRRLCKNPKGRECKARRHKTAAGGRAARGAVVRRGILQEPHLSHDRQAHRLMNIPRRTPAV
ncbi:hypothetical protein E2C01_095240 [Portunus trituberculatus]|uniref:Uncharacterized protein n=1 Tax=Portunus trituberculatus TaxID=210409 RepID=A0A5B7JPA8_PORTR|nr:hypothetical protein [Portunus trituberculatus]